MSWRRGNYFFLCYASFFGLARATAKLLVFGLLSGQGSLLISQIAQHKQVSFTI